MKKVWYDITNNTVVIDFEKILPSFNSEFYFEVEDEGQQNKHIRFYTIEWDGDSPTLIKMSPAEIQAIKDAEEAQKQATLDEMATEELLGKLIADERKNDGLNQNTPNDVRAKIDQMFESATTNAETVNVIKTILKKLAVRSLR